MVATVQKGADWIPARMLAGTTATSWWGKGGWLHVEGISQADLDAAVAAYDVSAEQVKEQADKELDRTALRDVVDDLDALIDLLVVNGVITLKALPAKSKAKNAARQTARGKL